MLDGMQRTSTKIVASSKQNTTHTTTMNDMSDMDLERLAAQAASVS
jgi:hypothetical protein